MANILPPTGSGYFVCVGLLWVEAVVSLNVNVISRITEVYKLQMEKIVWLKLFSFCMA